MPRRPDLIVLGYPEHLVADHAALVAAATAAGFDAEVVAPSRLTLALGLERAGGSPRRDTGSDGRGRDAVVLVDGAPRWPDVVLPRGVNRPWPLLRQLLDVWESAGVVVVPTTAAIDACADKLVTTRRLAAAGVPVLPSLGVVPGPGVQLDALGGEVGGEVGGGARVVSKPARGSKAAGVEVHADLAAATTALGHRRPLVAGMVDHQVVQPLATGAGTDLRIVVAATEGAPRARVVAVTRRHAPAGRVVTNLADGRVEDVDDPAVQLPAEVAVAERAAAVLGLAIAGVDVITHVGRPVVLEVNAWPGLAAEVRGTELADVLVAVARRVLAARPVAAGSGSAAWGPDARW